MKFRKVATLATYWMPLAPTKAKTPPHTNPVTMNGTLPGPAALPVAFRMNSLARKVATANHPTCNKPMRSPGMR